MAKKRKFVYKRRDPSSVKRRAQQRAVEFDSIWSNSVQIFTPKEGSYRLRIMPPTWEDADHYGYDLYVHYSVGADEASYLCPAKMKNERCPICEERERARAKGDADYAKELAPTRRVAVYVIDRNNEEDGPQIWAMPWTVDKDLAERCVDKTTNEVLLIDDPEEGYDITFSREGAGLRTKYVGIDIARRSTPLADDPDIMDEWLEQISENPIPDMLQFYPYEHIKQVFRGVVAAECAAADDEDDGEVGTFKSRRAARISERDIEEDDRDDEELDDEYEDKEDAEDEESPFGEEDEAVDEDDEDVDEDDEDEDDEEEIRPRRRRGVGIKRGTVSSRLRRR